MKKTKKVCLKTKLHKRVQDKKEKTEDSKQEMNLSERGEVLKIKILTK